MGTFDQVDSRSATTKSNLLLRCLKYTWFIRYKQRAEQKKNKTKQTQIRQHRKQAINLQPWNRTELEQQVFAVFLQFSLKHRLILASCLKSHTGIQYVSRYTSNTVQKFQRYVWCNFKNQCYCCTFCRPGSSERQPTSN